MWLLRVVETKKETLSCPSVAGLPFYKKTENEDGTLAKMPLELDIKQIPFILCFLCLDLYGLF